MIKMLFSLPFRQFIFFSLIILVVASCGPKSKNEQPAKAADTTSRLAPKTEVPKVKDEVVEKPLDKKETKPPAVAKKNEPAPITEVKKEPVEPKKEPAKEPVKETVPV